MTFQFLCPQGHLLQGEEAHMGMQCQCPQCGVAFIIPTIGGAQPATDLTAGVLDAGMDEEGAAGEVGEPLASELAPIHDPFFDDASTHTAAAGLNVSAPTADDLDVAEPQDSVLHIPCPNGHELDVPVEMLGHRAMCPHCGVEFRLKREKSIEYLHEQEIIERKRAQFWFRLAIIAAGVVGVVLLVMIAATMLS